MHEPAGLSRVDVVSEKGIVKSQGAGRYSTDGVRGIAPETAETVTERSKRSASSAAPSITQMRLLPFCVQSPGVLETLVPWAGMNSSE